MIALLSKDVPSEAFKPCIRCGVNPRRGGQKTCKQCHAAYMRVNRPKYSELTVEQRGKAIARSYARVYQMRGKLEPKPCAKCGAIETEKHHPDYAAPLFVIWLCRKCHLQLHIEEAAGSQMSHVEHRAAQGAS